MPKAIAQTVKPEVTRSAALSLTALPGDGGIRSRSVAILLADGAEGQSTLAVQAALQAAGVAVHLIASRLGAVQTAGGAGIEATGTFENSAPVLFDGVVLPDGAAGVELLGGFVEVMDFISSQHRHGKTILALGASRALLLQAGVKASLSNGESDPGIVVGADAEAERSVARFITALGKHRHPERELGA